MARANQLQNIYVRILVASAFLQGAFLCTSLNMYRALIVHICLSTAMHVYIIEHTSLNCKSQVH